MRNALRLACASTLLSTTILSATYAEELVSTVSSLDTVTVVATKSPRSTFDIPGMVTVVDTSAPSVAGASRLKDVLRDVPGVEFSGSARRNGQDIVLRGFTTDGLIVLLDGIRQKSESAHDGQFFIDPNLLKTVEVIRGPNSALYGSGGLGGVVSFTTKEASDLLAPGENRGAMTTAGFQSANDEWMVSQSGYARTDKFDVLASVLTRNSDDIELGDGNELVSEDEVLSGLFKLGWSINPYSTLKLNAVAYRNDAIEPNNPQTADNDDLVNKDTQSYTTSLTYSYDNPDNPLLGLTAQVYYNDISIDEDERDSDRDFSRDLDTFGASLENKSRFGIGSHFANTFAYGVDFYTENQNGADSDQADGEAGGIPDADTNFYGAFLQDEISLTSLGSLPGELLIIPGLRLDHYESDNDGGLSLDETELSPKLGVTYKPNDWLMVFGNYAEAFRAPTMTEIFSTGTHFAIPGPFGGENVFIPNPDLRPETNESLEFGFGIKFDDVVQANDHLRLKASYFDINSDDFIDTEVIFVPFPCCGTTQSVNVPKAELWGYEAEGGYENERIKLGLGLSYINGKNRETGEFLTNITPLTLTTNVAFKLPEYGSIVGWRSSFAKRHDNVNDPAEERDAYDVYDIYYQLQPKKLDNLTINLGVDNVFDENYERAFSGSPEIGRNYKLQVSYKW